MMESSDNEATYGHSPRSFRYFVQKGGICRSLELALLVAVEICLGIAAALESNKGLFHQIIVAIPIGTILLLIMSHLILGPSDSWPRLPCCSWAKMETAHDILMFALLLPSSLALLVPPFTRLEVAGAVLTLVMVLLVALQGVDNLHKVQQRRRSSSLQACMGSDTVSMSRLRRQRRKSAPNTPASFSSKLIPCSTPVGKSFDHRSLSPQSAQFSMHESESTFILNKRIDSNEWCSGRESPERMNPHVGSDSPKSQSFNCGTLSVFSSKTYILNNHTVESMCSLSKSPPGFTARKNKSFSPSAVRKNKSFSPSSKVLSPSPKLLKKTSSDVHGLTLFSKIKEDNRTKYNGNLKSSFVKVPMINLIEPSPELKFPHKKRINESEMGASPLLRESDVLSNLNGDHNPDSPLLYSNVSADIENPSTVSNLTPVCAVPSVEDSLRSNPRDALIEELGRKFSAELSQKPIKNITSLKSLDEFSPPKTFFNDSSKPGIAILPHPTPRQSIKMKSEVASNDLPSCRQPASEVSPFASITSSHPRLSSHTPNRLPSLPVLSTDYVRVYPTPQPFLRSIDSSLSLSNTLPKTIDQAEVKHTCLLKSQSDTAGIKKLAEDSHYYENVVELEKTQQQDKNTSELLEIETKISPARKLTPYQLLKNVALTTSQSVQRDEGVTSFRGKQYELMTEL